MGQEAAHLKHLLQFVDFKGTDVKLGIEPLTEARQFFPYPAMIWCWQTKQVYPFKQGQHINILEMIAVLNYFRSLSNVVEVHGHRCFHILDSKVSSSVIAKGRSSSRRLNRILRRLCPFQVGLAIRILPLWTISRWMPCDAGSRVFQSGV